MSLEQLTGKKIKDVEAYVAHESWGPCVMVGRVVFEDGTFLWTQGEHDAVYLHDYGGGILPDEEALSRMYHEENHILKDGTVDESECEDSCCRFSRDDE